MNRLQKVSIPRLPQPVRFRATRNFSQTLTYLLYGKVYMFPLPPCANSELLTLHLLEELQNKTNPDQWLQCWQTYNILVLAKVMVLSGYFLTQ
jgi:hypothetical protein